MSVKEWDDMEKRLIQAVAVTAELLGTDLSEIAAEVMCMDLSTYPLEQVLSALVRCRKEIKGRLTTADVIERIDDGRPLPDVAWAMIPNNEADSVVWSDEMAEAYTAAHKLMVDSNKISARLAFINQYKKLVSDARDGGVPVNWSPSFGFDATSREQAVSEAVRMKRITLKRGLELAPSSPLLLGHKEEPNLVTQRVIKRLAKRVEHKIPK